MQRAVLTLPPGSRCYLAHVYAQTRGLKWGSQQRRTSQAERNDIRAVRLLLQQGCSVSLPDDYGCTAKSLVCDTEISAMLDAFEESAQPGAAELNRWFSKHGVQVPVGTDLPQMQQLYREVQQRFQGPS